MRKILFILLFSIGGLTVRAQSVNSNCTPSAAFTYSYLNDARDLALKRIYQFHSADTAKIEVPQVWSDSILNDLAGICNLDTALSADSVFTIYCIHAVPHGFSFSSLTVKVDTNYAWTHQWELMNLVTGNAPLDNFLSAHGISLNHYWTSFPDSFFNNRAVLTTDHVLNMKAFADSLALFPGVEYCNIDPIVGDGDHILYSVEGVRHMSFDLGWSDCMAGCNNNRIWYYTLNNACNVSLDSVRSYLFTPEAAPITNCRLGANLVANVAVPRTISVWPNPTRDVLHISVIGTNAGQIRFVLSDVLGRAYTSGTIKQLATLNVANFPAGVYVLKLVDENGHESCQKIVKE